MARMSRPLDGERPPECFEHGVHHGVNELFCLHISPPAPSEGQTRGQASIAPTPRHSGWFPNSRCVETVKGVYARTAQARDRGVTWARRLADLLPFWCGVKGVQARRPTSQAQLLYLVW